MKKIYNLMLTIILIMIVLLVYLNIDKIVSVTVKLFGDEKKVTLIKPNDYKKSYTVTHLKNYSTEEDYIPYNESDIENIMYNILNNGWESFSFYCPKEYTNCKKDVEKIANDEKKLSDINNYVSPFNSYKEIHASVYVDGKVLVKVTKNYRDEEIKEINTLVDQKLNEFKLTNLSTKQKIEKIHDYFVLKTTYDKTRSETGKSNYLSNKIQGPLKEGQGICSGLSDTMAIFLDKIDVPNIKVASQKHVWNLAYIDGKWMHIDLTWDLPIENNTDYIHTFLLISTKELKALDTKEHVWDTNMYIEAN